jgi:acyl-CoA thioesterase-1
LRVPAGRSRRRSTAFRPPHESRSVAVATTLAPASWAAWRLLRSGHWNNILNERRRGHVRYWERLAHRRGDVLYVAIGDSTAQGLGARDPSGSYVGQLDRMLDARLTVVNLSISGARLSDVIASLLPRMARLDTTDALVTFAVGANNIGGFEPERFRQQLATIFDALPDHALIAELPSFYVRPFQARVRAANAILHELADERNLAVIPLHQATNRLRLAAIATHHAKDLFHPNDRGYRVWAKTFLGPAAARLEQITAGTPARDVAATSIPADTANASS